MDQFSLKGQTAVITGAARGLGLAFAEAVASAHCNIAVLDILQQPSAQLLDLRTLHNIKVEYYKTDITSPTEVTCAISQIEQDFGTIDININAAGIVKDEPFLTTSQENLQRTFAVNFFASYHVAQCCASSMAKRYNSTSNSGGTSPAKDPTTGTILFIASIATHISTAAQTISCYTASKAAIKGLVKPLAMELAPYGIRVNSLSPGYMMTDMMRGLRDERPELVSQFEKETMFGRIGEPQELMGAVLFLCSGAGRWVTGQDLLVDGGASSWKHEAPL